MHGPNKAYGQCMDQSQHVVNAQCMVQIDFKFSTLTNLDLQTLLQMQYTVHCTAYTTHCTVYSYEGCKLLFMRTPIPDLQACLPT